MIEKKYKNYKIFSTDNRTLKIGERILDKKFNIIKKMKDTPRNYVVIVEIDNVKYVLKSPRNEFRIPQRKFFTLFKEGEAVSTFKNINKLIEKGVDYFAIPLVAISKKEKGMIVDSHIVYEYIEGRDSGEDKALVVKHAIKMHKLGVYHGDCNPSNFIISSKGIKIIDTQSKRMLLGKFRAHYDMLTLKLDSYDEMEYPYSKDVWYWMAYGLKKWKRIPIVEKIKAYKKNLRDKGWKV